MKQNVSRMRDMKQNVSKRLSSAEVRFTVHVWIQKR